MPQDTANEYRIQDKNTVSGCRMQDAGYRMQDTGYRIQDKALKKGKSLNEFIR